MANWTDLGSEAGAGGALGVLGGVRGALGASGEEGRMTALACVYCVVLLLGLPLNATALWVLVWRHGLKSSTATLMINLAAADLLLALSLPLRVQYYATGGRWAWGRAVCTASTLLLRNNVRTSSVFITLLSLDRLLAIVLPLRSRALRSAPHALAACAAVWLLVCVLAVPEAQQLYAILPEHDCFEVRSGAPVVTYVQSGLIFALLVVNVISTYMVAQTLRLRGSPTATEQRRRRVRCLLIFGANLLMFAVFFVPLSVILLLMSSGVCEPRTFHIMVCLTSVNCCLDPPLYYFCLDGFWHPERSTTTDTDADADADAGVTLRDTDWQPTPASAPCTDPLD